MKKIIIFVMQRHIIAKSHASIKIYPQIVKMMDFANMNILMILKKDMSIFVDKETISVMVNVFIKIKLKHVK